MKGIIAVNNLGYIGLNNSLPWRCKEDLKHFKALTLNCRLIAGIKTLQTLPPLKDREVITWRKENKDLMSDILVMNIDWCIGGKKTYEKFCHLFTELHISYINDNTVGDVMFPDLKNLNKSCKVFKYYFETNTTPIIIEADN